MQRKSKYTQMISIARKVAEVTLAESGSKHEDFSIDAGTKIEEDMDKFSAEDALDTLLAYYADELKYTVGVISKQVIERHFVDTLSTDVLSPRVIAGLSDTQISMLTSEAPEVASNRERLEERQKVLERGIRIFREALGGFS